MCSCGEIIRTTGEDLNDFSLSDVKSSFKDRLPSLLEIQIIFAIIIIVPKLSDFGFDSKILAN